MIEYADEIKLSTLLKSMQNRILTRSTYRGIPTQKNPVDMWVYFELISRIQPNVIVEIGNYMGGSTLMLSDYMKTIGIDGHVIAVDICHSRLSSIVTEAKGITRITGDACQRISAVEPLCKNMRVMVIEDSSHTYDNTLNIMQAYSGLVSIGSYMIIEDTICHHGLSVGPNPGPFEAVSTFIASDNRFMIDRECESFGLTWNPRGFLRRIA